MRKIVKITSILGTATLVKMFAGVIRAKFLAWQIGPVGVGIVSQALTYSIFAIQLCSLNICTGIVKDVSEALREKDEGMIARIVSTSLTLEVACSLLLIAVVLPFSAQLSKFVFSDPKYCIYFIGITVVTPLAVFITGIADPVFYGLRKIAVYTRVIVYYTLFGLIAVFPLVYFLKTDGMLVQLILAAIGGSLISFYFLRKELGPALKVDLGLFKDRSSRSVMSGLFQYGATSFIMALIVTFTTLYVRSLLIKQFGAAANGHYQVAYSISAYYLPFITNAIWGYFYPEMCALKSNADINRELNQFIRFALFASTAIAALCIIFREYIILALYSREFMAAYGILPIQAAGDIFFIIFYVFTTSLLARKKFKSVMLLSAVGYNATIVAIYITLTKFLMIGFESANIAIACANLAFATALMIYHKMDTGFVLNNNNVKLLIKNAIFIGVIYFLPGTGILAAGAKSLLSVAWLFLAFTRDELKSSYELVTSSIKKRVSGL